MYFDQLCQKWKYCYQNCANTSHLFPHTRRYITHYRHLYMTRFHTHPHHTTHSGAWGTIWPTFVVHVLLTWNLHWSFILPYYTLLHRVRVRERTCFQSIFTPYGCFEGCRPCTIYYMTNFCCVMSPTLQFEMKLGIGVSYLAAKEQIPRKNGSSLTYTPPWCTTVVSRTRHTLGSTFVVWNLLKWDSQWSCPWMYNAMVQRYRYGTWSVHHLHTPPWVHHGGGQNTAYVIRQTLSKIGILLPNLYKHLAFILLHTLVSHAPSASVYDTFWQSYFAVVGCNTRHMYFDQLCQKWRYCYQNCANTSHLFPHTRRYITHYRHLYMTRFHTHPHHTTHSGAWGTIWPTFVVHVLLTWNLHWSFILPYYTLLHRVRVRERTCFQSIFTPYGCFEGCRPCTIYYMTNFCCVMSPTLQFEMKLGIGVSYLAAKEQIPRKNGSSLTYTPPWCTTVVSRTRHTLGSTFVVWNLLKWDSQWSCPWMYNAMVQRYRYGTWSVHHLHTPPWVHHGGGQNTAYVIRQTLSKIGILLPNLSKHVIHIAAHTVVSHSLSAFVCVTFS